MAEVSESGGRVVVVGAINTDIVINAPRLPGRGETVVGDSVQRFGGGKGANAAVAAARAGADVRLIGAVGKDADGAHALQDLTSDQVNVEAVSQLDGVATGAALIVVDADGDNQIAVGAGANGHVCAETVAGVLESLLPVAGCVLVSTEIHGPAAAAAVRRSVDAGVGCILNPAPVIPEILDLRGPHLILTPNRYEAIDFAARITGEAQSDVSEAAVARAGAALTAHTGGAVVITLGGDGVLVCRGAEQTKVPALPATVRDTTGAGDTFNGVLAARLAAGDDLRTAVVAAVTAASISVASAGARTGMPTWRQIQEVARDRAAELLSSGVNP
ncbi:ribokinase [Sporichthya brevicatena]|uniref:Ribokinase n=1 Tax=Sporichthya brevicatena TaxID=171442 RepID=A0ABN1G391_9ACTN